MNFNFRFLLPLAVLVLLVFPATRSIVTQVLSEAFLQVSVFVFTSLAIYYALTKNLDKARFAEFMRKHPVSEVLIAAGLGALPGCGGAIVVVTQFTKGVTSFGAVVAVLTSTMGDAAFLLLAQKPADALVIIGISVAVGALSGMAVNAIHRHKTPDYLRPKRGFEQDQPQLPVNATRASTLNFAVRFWQIIFIPALAGGILVAMQYDLNQVVGLPRHSIEIATAIIGLTILILWSFTSSLTGYSSITSEEPSRKQQGWLNKAVLDTQFVTSWVVVAFLAFELPVQLLGIDLTAIFQSVGALVILFAILIGFLPGCGPQILVTTLYINGSIPFSAQLGNAISNDGDALFPAIALAPKAAVVATVYSAIPAFIVAYGYYYLFE